MDTATDNNEARAAKRVRTDTSTTPSENSTVSKQQRQSPTKAALDTLEQQIESLPDNLAELARHFGTNIIRLRAKLFNKIAVSKRMNDDEEYIPKSARASDFEITTSKAAAEEYPERIELLNQQVAQAKLLYQQSLKTVVEECAELEINVLKKQENHLVSEILERTATATNREDGIECNVHLKVTNIIRYDAKIFKYGTSTDRNEIRNKYIDFHGLNALPEPSLRILRNEYQTQAEAVAAQAEVSASMRLPENKGIQQYRKLLETILFLPSRAFHLQHEKNKKDTAMKKLVTEIIDGTKTEEAAMELDNEAAANMEQLQDLIRKESDKRDKKYKDLEQKYSTLLNDMKKLKENKPSAKNDNPGGRPSAPTNQRNTGTTRRNDNSRNENRNNRGGGRGRGRGRNGNRSRGQQRSTSRSDMRRGTGNRNRNNRNNNNDSHHDQRAADDNNGSGNDSSRRRDSRSRTRSRSRNRRS